MSLAVAGTHTWAVVLDQRNHRGGTLYRCVDCEILRGWPGHVKVGCKERQVRAEPAATEGGTRRIRCLDCGHVHLCHFREGP